MSNKIFLVFIAVLMGIGLLAGWFLSAREHVSIPNLINVIGIIYSLTAVFVLYETVASSSSLRTFTVDYVAPAILWAHTVVPLGLALSWFLTLGSPSGGKIASFGLSFVAYSVLPLGFLDATVTFPRIKQWKPTEIRHRRFGLYLLVSGLSMQLIAALKAV